MTVCLFAMPPQQFLSLVVSHDRVTAIPLALHTHTFILTVRVYVAILTKCHQSDSAMFVC